MSTERHRAGEDSSDLNAALNDLNAVESSAPSTLPPSASLSTTSDHVCAVSSTASMRLRLSLVVLCITIAPIVSAVDLPLLRVSRHAMYEHAEIVPEHVLAPNRGWRTRNREFAASLNVEPVRAQRGSSPRMVQIPRNKAVPVYEHGTMDPGEGGRTEEYYQLVESTAAKAERNHQMVQDLLQMIHARGE